MLEKAFALSCEQRMLPTCSNGRGDGVCLSSTVTKSSSLESPSTTYLAQIHGLGKIAVKDGEYGDSLTPP